MICGNHVCENSLMSITALPFHLTSWNFTQRLPLSWGWPLMMSGSKDQMSRSQFIDSWKQIFEQIFEHNWFPFTPKHLDTLHHDFRICPIDVRVKRSKSQCIDYLKWFLAHNCFPFTTEIINLHTYISSSGYGIKNLSWI